MGMENLIKHPALTAGLLVAGLTVGTNVQAASVYAVSINEITNFSMSFNNGSGTLNGFTFSNSTAATDVTGTSNVNVLDADASCLNCSFNNDFNSHLSTASEFVYGDSRIGSSNLVSPNAGSASAIAEANISSGTAYANGSNVMNSFSGLVVIDDTIAPLTSLGFSFNANPFMSVDGGNGNIAAMSMYIQLKDASNSTVWSWEPTALNKTLLNGTYTAGNGPYSSSTGGLEGGTYSLTIGMSQTVNINAVPVPAAVWLFGSGLLGLIGVARRKR